MVIVTNNALDCTTHWRDITKNENSTAAARILDHYPSVSKEYAEQLEVEHISKLVDHDCVRKKIDFTVLDETYTVPGTVLTVTRKCIENGDNVGENITLTITKNGNDLVYNTTIELDNITECKDETVDLLSDELLFQDKTLIINGVEFSDIKYVTHKYTQGSTNSQSGDDVCASMCVPLPYEDINEIPNGLDWFSPLRWWDVAFLAVACIVQFRLRSIEDVDGYGAYGPFVVDEKDIAITSLQMLMILQSAFFYCVEVSISSTWLALHSNDSIDKDHASYFTVLERNNMLVITNSIWIFLIIPMFVVAFRVKNLIQKYEQNQFLTEL